MGLREIKAQSRGRLHQAMQVPAFYIADPAEDPLPEPVKCGVRVHTKNEALGEIKGTSFDYSERHETIPALVFLRAEVDAPANGSVVTIVDPATGQKEAYRVDNRHPPDGITVTAEVTVMAANEYADLPFRED